jgi:hypothetical protein
MSTETKKMSIHRALAELKLLGKKIMSLTQEISLVEKIKEGSKINGHLTVEEFQKKAQSNWDSVSSLIKNKRAIKCAIVASNAITEVTIGGKTMTVADAITEKDNIEFKKMLLSRLIAQERLILSQIEQENAKVDAKIHDLLKSEGQKNKEEIEAVQLAFKKINNFSYVDPLKIADKIENLNKEILDFESEVDSVLSEINATTFIEVAV